MRAEGEGGGKGGAKLYRALQIDLNFGDIKYIYNTFLSEVGRGACELLLTLFEEDIWFNRRGFF